MIWCPEAVYPDWFHEMTAMFRPGFYVYRTGKTPTEAAILPPEVTVTPFPTGGGGGVAGEPLTVVIPPLQIDPQQLPIAKAYPHYAFADTGQPDIPAGNIPATPG